MIEMTLEAEDVPPEERFGRGDALVWDTALSASRLTRTATLIRLCDPEKRGSQADEGDPGGMVRFSPGGDDVRVRGGRWPRLPYRV